MIVRIRQVAATPNGKQRNYENVKRNKGFATDNNRHHLVETSCIKLMNERGGGLVVSQERRNLMLNRFSVFEYKLQAATVSGLITAHIIWIFCHHAE